MTKRLGVFLACVLSIASSPAPAPAGRVVYLARHAEKDRDKAFDADDASRPLTAVGREQAEGLAMRLEGAKIGAVFYSAIEAEGGPRPIERTRATAEPLIRSLEARDAAPGVRPIPYPEALRRNPWDASALESYARGVVDHIEGEAQGAAVLVVGHENTIPAIVRELARRSGRAIGPDAAKIAPAQFDLLFTVTTEAEPPAEFLRREAYFPAAK